MPIRTRFAPSPTGYLHVGSARTALFNWAFARHHGDQGHFALRIEDTDRERSTRASLDAILDGLAFLQLDFDGPVVSQSDRRERHLEVIDLLLAEGKAYRCVCTREELEAQRQAATQSRAYDGRCRDRALGPDCGEHTVRLRLPDDANLSWNDLVFGPSGQEAAQLGDMILRRADGSPLYNLAVAVDDLDMQITHVIRGADHLSNTSIQIAIYQAMGESHPEFAHVPLIVGASGQKLSKRRDPVSIQDFQKEGYLPEALLNWMIRLGWSHGDEEIFDREAIGHLFDLGSVGRSSAQVDPAKLQWLNQHYLKAIAMPDLLEALDPHMLARTQKPAPRTAGFEALVDLLRERSKTLEEMAEKSSWAVVDEVVFDEKAAKKHLRSKSLPLLEALVDALLALPDWNTPALETAFESVRVAQGDISMGKLAQPVRVAITGTSVSPGIYETLYALGRDRSLARIQEAIERIQSQAGDAIA